MRISAGISAADMNQSATESLIFARPSNRLTCYSWDSIWISMRILPLRFRLRWLRALVGTLLALHVGMAQASIAHGGAMHEGVRIAHFASQTGLTTARCHGEALTAGLAPGDHGASPVTGSPSPPENRGARHSPCCETGDCHCSAACYHSVATAFVVVAIVTYVFATPVDARATVPPQLARELRPPIVI